MEDDNTSLTQLHNKQQSYVDYLLQKQTAWKELFKLTNNGKKISMKPTPLYILFIDHYTV